MCQMVSPGSNRFFCGSTVAGSMSEGNRYFLVIVSDKVDIVGDVWGDRYQTDGTRCSLLTGIKKCCTCWTQIACLMSIFFCLIQKWSFHIDTGDTGITGFHRILTGSRLICSDVCQMEKGWIIQTGVSGFQSLLRQCHGGWTVGRDAVCSLIG